MTITVDARPGEIRTLCTQESIDPLECDWDDASCTTVVSVLGREFDRLMIAIKNAGYRWWRGRPRGAHGDPTFAQAAQHILRREHGR